MRVASPRALASALWARARLLPLLHEEHATKTETQAAFGAALAEARAGRLDASSVAMLAFALAAEQGGGGRNNVAVLLRSAWDSACERERQRRQDNEQEHSAYYDDPGATAGMFLGALARLPVEDGDATWIAGEARRLAAQPRAWTARSGPVVAGALARLWQQQSGRRNHGALPATAQPQQLSRALWRSLSPSPPHSSSSKTSSSLAAVPARDAAEALWAAAVLGLEPPPPALFRRLLRGANNKGWRPTPADAARALWAVARFAASSPSPSSRAAAVQQQQQGGRRRRARAAAGADEQQQQQQRREQHQQQQHKQPARRRLSSSSSSSSPQEGGGSKGGKAAAATLSSSARSGLNAAAALLGLSPASAEATLRPWLRLVLEEEAAPAASASAALPLAMAAWASARLGLGLRLEQEKEKEKEHQKQQSHADQAGERSSGAAAATAAASSATAVAALLSRAASTPDLGARELAQLLGAARLACGTSTSTSSSSRGRGSVARRARHRSSRQAEGEGQQQPPRDGGANPNLAVLAVVRCLLAESPAAAHALRTAPDADALASALAAWAALPPQRAWPRRQSSQGGCAATTTTTTTAAAAASVRLAELFAAEPSPSISPSALSSLLWASGRLRLPLPRTTLRLLLRLSAGALARMTAREQSATLGGVAALAPRLLEEEEDCRALLCAWVAAFCAATRPRVAMLLLHEHEQPTTAAADDDSSSSGGGGRPPPPPSDPALVEAAGFVSAALTSLSRLAGVLACSAGGSNEPLAPWRALVGRGVGGGNASGDAAAEAWLAGAAAALVRAWPAFTAADGPRGGRARSAANAALALADLAGGDCGLVVGDDDEENDNGDTTPTTPQPPPWLDRAWLGALAAQWEAHGTSRASAADAAQVGAAVAALCRLIEGRNGIEAD
jgi:hypothetical protein